MSCKSSIAASISDSFCMSSSVSGSFPSSRLHLPNIIPDFGFGWENSDPNFLSDSNLYFVEQIWLLDNPDPDLYSVMKKAITNQNLTDEKAVSQFLFGILGSGSCCLHRIRLPSPFTTRSGFETLIIDFRFLDRNTFIAKIRLVDTICSTLASRYICPFF